MQDEYASRDGRLRRQGAARRAAAGGDVVDFAAWVVGLISARRAAAGSAVRTDLIAAFRRAVTAEDIETLHAFLEDLPRHGVDSAAVADLYIPALARMLGEDWMDDRATFAEVSLAAARLQALLRELGAAWNADGVRRGRTQGTVLLAVPPGEQHTLGAMVLLGQLRRLGVSVRLGLAPDRAELRKIMKNVSFDGVLVSLSCSRRLAETRVFVDLLRACAPPGLPLVAGGSVLQAGVVTPAELAEVVGADVATADLAQALSVFGLSGAARGNAPRRTGASA